MKRYILGLSLLLITGVVFGYCNFNNSIANAALPAFTGLGAPGTVTVKIWKPGSADFATNGSAQYPATTCTAGGATGGCDSDGMGMAADMPGDCATFDNTAMMWQDTACGFGPANAYWVISDWSYPGFDGCPSAGDRMALLAYDTAGNYGLITRTGAGGWGNLDDIGTVAAAPLNVDGVFSLALGSVNTVVDVTYAMPNSLTYGAYAGGDAPSGPLATQFRVYFYQGAVAPVNFSTAAWTAGGTYAIGTGLVDDMAIPAWISGQYTYMSYSLIFEGYEMPFVSTAYRTLHNPSGAPVITASSAVKNGVTTIVNWTSGDESRVTGYQVFWAPAGTSNFTAVGSRVNPAGNGNNYTAEVRIPTTNSYVVKVGAYLMDGTTEYGSPANINSNITIKDRTRVSPN